MVIKDEKGKQFSKIKDGNEKKDELARKWSGVMFYKEDIRKKEVEAKLSKFWKETTGLKPA